MSVTKEDFGKMRMTAKDLFMLCRRADVALKHGDPERAREILGHAQRIAGRVGIKESIIRAQ